MVKGSILQRQDYTAKVAHLFDGLRIAIGHDPVSAKTLDDLWIHVQRNINVLSVGRRIESQVGEAFDYALAETNAWEPKSFNDQFENALARIGSTLSMARTAGVSQEDQEYLTARVTDALAGEYQQDMTFLNVPMIENELDKDDGSTLSDSVVELAHRVLGVEAPLLNTKPDQIEFVIKSKTDRRAKLYEIVRSYDPSSEVAFEEDRLSRRSIEQDRLDRFKATGEIDPSVDVLPMFEFYEDQILLNLQQIDSHPISSEKHVFNLSLAEIESIDAEIVLLEINLANARDNTAAKVA